MILRLFLISFFFFSCTPNFERDFFTDFSEGIKKAEKKYEVGKEKGSFYIYKIDPKKFDFEVLYGEPKLVFEWAEDFDKGVFVNGGFFDENFYPTGFLYSGRKRVGKRIYDKDKSGTFLVSDSEIKIAENFNEEKTYDSALQSFPVLIKNGVNNIKSNTQKIARRTAIGMDKLGFFYIFILDETDLSLYDFAEEIEKLPVDFDMVLNLDGGTSTGISFKLKNKEENIFSLAKVPSVLKITPKDD